MTPAWSGAEFIDKCVSIEQSEDDTTCHLLINPGGNTANAFGNSK